MALVVISIDERKLPAHTREEFEEWVRFCVGDRSDIQNANPLSDLDLQATVREVSWFWPGPPNEQGHRLDASNACGQSGGSPGSASSGD